ncbi:hypothetical protein BKL49_03000 [Rodentibacter myodis]|uniref:Uncharacterized protein n=1 Tax=Rodentibacter myodis TaxID=1907939 RepID=A0A1V3JSZ4_9PAST|nr:hypothetical protein BKL49_03000 [Rodentibacter myodis]
MAGFRCPVFYALTRAILHRNGEHNNGRGKSAVIFHCVFVFQNECAKKYPNLLSLSNGKSEFNGIFLKALNFV